MKKDSVCVRGMQVRVQHCVPTPTLADHAGFDEMHARVLIYNTCALAQYQLDIDL